MRDILGPDQLVARPRESGQVAKHALQLLFVSPVAQSGQGIPVSTGDRRCERNDDLGREGIARRGLHRNMADYRTRCQQLAVSGLGVGIRSPDQEGHDRLANQVLRRSAKNGRAQFVGVDDDAVEVHQEERLGGVEEEVAVRQLRRLRTRYRPIGTLAVPEQGGHARLAFELRQTDGLDVGTEPFRVAIAGSHVDLTLPAAQLENLHGERGPARVIAANEGQTVDPGCSQGVGGGDAEDPHGVVVPEHDQAARIDDRQPCAEVLQEPEVMSGQSLCHVLSSRARLSLRTYVGACIVLLS